MRRSLNQEIDNNQADQSSSESQIARANRKYPNRMSTDIIENEEPNVAGPYCALPSHFFDHAKQRDPARKVVLAVHTWDGRRVLEIES